MKGSGSMLQILLYHVLPDTLLSKDLKDGLEVATVNGETVGVSSLVEAWHMVGLVAALLHVAAKCFACMPCLVQGRPDPGARPLRQQLRAATLELACPLMAWLHLHRSTSRARLSLSCLPRKSPPPLWSLLTSRSPTPPISWCTSSTMYVPLAAALMFASKSAGACWVFLLHALERSCPCAQHLQVTKPSWWLPGSGDYPVKARWCITMKA
jgi:hypothetical protein